MSKNSIEEALGLRPIEEALQELAGDYIDLPAIPEEKTIEIALINPDEDETLKDIEQARANIKNIIEYGDDSLKEMIALAKQSESPRAFEVASTLMKTLLDANKDFVEMSMKKKYTKDELNGPKEAAQTNVTNNNLIVSTADLLKMIKGE